MQSKTSTKYLSQMTDRKYNLAMEQWLEKISEELEFLSRRMEEVERENEEFLNGMKGQANQF